MNHYSQSIYLQLSDSIKQKIISGIYRPGDKIPSEREMSLAYGITRAGALLYCAAPRITGRSSTWAPAPPADSAWISTAEV